MPLFAIVLSALFLPDEPMRVNGLVGLARRVRRGRHRHEPRAHRRGVVAQPASSPCWAPPFSYACGAVYSRRNVRGLPADDPGGLPGDVRDAHHGHHRARSFEHPWTATPDAEAIFSILWLGILGSGLAYLLVFRLFAHWGATRTTLVAYLIPVVGIVLGYLVLAEPIDARIIVGTGAGHRGRRRSSTAGSAGAGSSAGCRRCRRSRPT